jgi:Cupin-like domain
MGGANSANNNLYMTGYNASHNDLALSAVRGDMGTIDRYLDPTSDGRYRMMWIGPAGTITRMHHDLTNNLLVQVAGRKVIKLVPATQVDAMYNHIHVFSAVSIPGLRAGSSDSMSPLLRATRFSSPSDGGIRCGHWTSASR